jgi:hypothetical protein
MNPWGNSGRQRIVPNDQQLSVGVKVMMQVWNLSSLEGITQRTMVAFEELQINRISSLSLQSERFRTEVAPARLRSR